MKHRNSSIIRIQIKKIKINKIYNSKNNNKLMKNIKKKRD